MSRIPKTPAFPFYGKDAYDDEAFCRLSFAEQGFYLFLAWWQWQEGSIPGEFDALLTKIPRGKVAEARRSWFGVEPFFQKQENGRRLDASIERRREKVVAASNGKRRGAEITNAKRSPNNSQEGTLSVPLKDEPSARSELQMQVQSTPYLSGDKPGGAGGLDFSAIGKTYEFVVSIGFDPTPSEQTVIAVIGEFGQAFVDETLTDCAAECRGKSWRYFEAILTKRRNNPNERPANRFRRGIGGRTSQSKISEDQAARAAEYARKFPTKSLSDLQREQK